MTRPRDYQPGEKVPGTVYRVVRLIGAGGMGTVYDVEDTTVGKRYVLKTLHPELHKRGDLADRMVKEARTLARLAHPNIVEVVTAGATTDDLKLPFYVMEKLNGQSLHTILTKKGSLELSHAMHITIDLLEALDNAHEKSVIHRDVKPDNIFLHINNNGQTTTKLLDFGIMRVLDEPGVTAGRFMGTLRYAAPEQLRGETPLPQTDLYAVGLVLYEMIAGKGPFDDEGDSQKVAAAHLSSTPPPLLHWGVVVPEALERLVRSALSKDPQKRPKDAFTFASQLRNMYAAISAERRTGSVNSRPTAVPILSLDSQGPSSDLTRDPSAGPATPDVASASVVGLARTEHAATRAGTPAAKSPHSPQDPAPLITAAATSGATVRDLSAAPSTGPTIAVSRRGASSAAATASGGGRTERTLEPPTVRAPDPVDRNAPTHSAPGQMFAAPPLMAGGQPSDPQAPNDGSTLPIPTAGARDSRAEAAAWKAPGTLRMSSAPPRPGDDGGASALLAGLASQQPPVAATDGAASNTVTPGVATRVRPAVAVSIGLALSAATLATLGLLVWGIRGRLAAPELPSLTAAPAPAAAAPATAGPGSSFPSTAPTIPPPLDLPPPAESAPSAAPVPAAVPSSSAATAAPPAAPAPPAHPGASVEPVQPARPKPAPSSPPPRRKLPGSGL